MLDFCTAAPVTINFNGKPFKVGALKLKEEGELVAYLRKVVPRPTVAIREILDLFPPEDRRRELIAAVQADRDWPPAAVSPEGQKILLGTPEGQKTLLGLMLRKYQPDLSDAELDDVLGDLNDEDFLVLVQIAFGADYSDPEALRATVRNNLRALAALLAGTGAPTPDDATPTGASSSTASS